MDNQKVGNLDMYYVCYMLSQKEWNVMPTARNARGIDIIAYKDDGRFVGIQVKTFSKPCAIPIGRNREKIMGDYWCVVVRQKNADPKVYVLTPDEVRAGCPKPDGKGSYWVPFKAYSVAAYENNWDKIRPK